MNQALIGFISIIPFSTPLFKKTKGRADSVCMEQSNIKRIIT
jgi:hypothetical protein